jgi:Uma2 family endonuclease
MSQSLIRRITYQELCELPDDGHRYELLDGEAYMCPSPNLRHQLILERLHMAFRSAAPDRTRVIFAPMDVVLADATALQPDLIVVLEGRREILKDVVRGAPDLVVEVVSPSTVKRDRGPKLQAYGRYGITEYWIVDHDGGTVEAYRLTPAGAYGAPVVCRRGDMATTPLLPRLALDVAALLAE